jgi:outer membrane protein OmpA-like peptidoglycan-associated protein
VKTALARQVLYLSPYGMLRSFRSVFFQIMPRNADKMSDKKITTKLSKPSVISALLIAASLGIPAIAQSSSSTPAQVQTGTTTAQSSTNANPSDNSTYATGQPLQTKSNEGFWGHMNPFARKKWVNRQIDPVKDRLNELDQLQAKNANDIKDVDSRAQSGIHQAQSTADQANQTAVAANTTATQANQTAMQASDRTTKLNSTVSGLDQYQKVNDTEIRFRPGQTALNAKAKDALGQIATQLQGQKGYIVEVAGYSHLRGQAGIANSQHMTDAVVRYLAEQQIPVYRIHQLAMGNAPVSDTEGVTRGSVVRVTLLQNSLAALNSSSSDGGSPIGATQQSSAQPSPQGAASHSTGQQQ